jgi:pimeloyl-ACP methyl ester carboxylesterase
MFLGAQLGEIYGAQGDAAPGDASGFCDPGGSGLRTALLFSQALLSLPPDATFERSAAAFDNSDFVDIVIHSYRHRFGLVPGDPAVAHIETRLVVQPPILVPAITIDGDADGVNRGTAHHASKFTGLHRHRVFRGAGHNTPQERPAEWVQAVLDARAMAATA